MHTKFTYLLKLSSLFMTGTREDHTEFRYKPTSSNDFFIQFNVSFKIISLIETSQSIGGVKREYPGKTT